jgi:hypothetical protein
MKNIEELKEMWNKAADKNNQWEELGLDEIVHFAQEQMKNTCVEIVEDLANESDPDDFSLDSLNAAADAMRAA